MRYQYLLIDNDNTLMDFNAAERKALRDTLTAYGLPADDAVCTLYHEINDAQWKALERGETTQKKLKVERYRLLLEQLGCTELSAAEVSAAYEANLGSHADLLPGAADFIHAVHGKMKIALVSNGVSAIQRSRLAKCPLTPLFDAIVISEEAGVSLSGKYTYVTGLEDVFVTSGDNGDTRDGNILVDGGNVLVTAAKVAATVVESSAVVVTKNIALVGSDSGSALVAGKSAMIINGKKVPMLWVDIDEAPDLSDLKDIWDTLQTSDIIQPMDWKNLVENALFSFRKSSELLVNNGLAPWEPGGGFKMYEPYWQVMHDVGDPLAVGSPYHPKAESVHGSKCWPCVGPIDGGVFVTYGYGNIEKGLSKKRDSLDPYVGLIRGSMGEFKT